jgi:hypothetical protein
MLLGNEEQALGRNDVARTHYREAAALCPSAQSPHIALSQLARQSGDRTEALAAMKQLVTLPADDRDRRDPWWTYYIWFHKNAESLLGELYRPFVPGGQS